MAARFELNHAQIKSRFKLKSISAAKAVADAILHDSEPFVPKQQGTMRDTGRVEVTLDEQGGELRRGGHVEDMPDGAAVVWDTVYAAYQWYGCWPDGTHVVKHHTTPGTVTQWVYKAMRKYKDDWDQIAQNAEEKL